MTMGGYKFSGQLFTGDFTLTMANLTQTTTPETGGDVLTGSQIVDDAWNYGISVQGGAFGLGANSPAIAAFSISDKSGYFLETGPVVN